MAKKTTPTTMTPTTILLTVVAILVLAYIIVTATAAPGPADTPEEPAIESASGLDAAEDELNSVNIDAMDSGLDDVGTEVRSY